MLHERTAAGRIAGRAVTFPLGGGGESNSENEIKWAALLSALAFCVGFNVAHAQNVGDGRATTGRTRRA